MIRRFVILAACLCAAPALAGTPRLQADPTWPPPLPHHWKLGEVSGVAVDAADNVWIVQRPATLSKAARKQGFVPAPPVIEFDSTGHVLRAWGGKGAGYDWFGNEHGIYIGPGGDVWLGGNGAQDGQILKFTQDGRFLLQIGHPAKGANSNDTSRLSRPADMAEDATAHEVYVADGYGNRRVIVFDSRTGAYKRHWGAYGELPSDSGGPRQFGRPVHCVKLARDGFVYVCDRQNDRIQVFQHDGHFVTEFRIAPDTGGMGSVWDLALSPDAGQDMLFNADGQNNVVRILRRADGLILGAFGRPGHEPGEFQWVHNLAIDSHGNVFTTEVAGGERVQRFVPVVGP